VARAQVKIHLMYTGKNFGVLRPVAIDAISAWCREIGNETVIAGMKLAVKKGDLHLAISRKS
jgi:hypothetical protein